ncbi:hypothetical protein BXZ70DRAFT_633735 [Cristinia sonorae]|uniref:F-box domain-containing protein n=1 Tax=Cristinia sonorae TaxID=1940300 RepID=A0A8K0UFA8_9AGAR|nr:hypothetical protein BXZ70DRAFT_633735 [Cristinia sonorae]
MANPEWNCPPLVGTLQTRRVALPLLSSLFLLHSTVCCLTLSTPMLSHRSHHPRTMLACDNGTSVRLHPYTHFPHVAAHLFAAATEFRRLQAVYNKRLRAVDPYSNVSSGGQDLRTRKVPINALPPELLTEIFKLCMGPVPRGEDMHRDIVHQRQISSALYRDIYRFLPVCRYWRDVVSSSMNPLWSRIDVSYPNIVSRIIDNIGECPINQSVHIRGLIRPGDTWISNAPFLTKLRTHSSRVETLELSCEDPNSIRSFFQTFYPGSPSFKFSKLTHLSLHGSSASLSHNLGELRHDFPELQTLFLENIFFVPSSSAPCLPKLLSLTILCNNTAPSHILSLLMNAPKLVTFFCEFSKARATIDEGASQQLDLIPTHELNQLKKITLCGLNSDLAREIYNRLTLPEIEHIEFRFTNFIRLANFLQGQPDQPQCNALVDFNACTCPLQITHVDPDAEAVCVSDQNCYFFLSRLNPRDATHPGCHCASFRTDFDVPASFQDFIDIIQVFNVSPNVADRVKSLELSFRFVVLEDDTNREGWPALLHHYPSLDALSLVNVEPILTDIADIAQGLVDSPDSVPALRRLQISFTGEDDDDVAADDLTQLREIYCGLWEKVVQSCPGIDSLDVMGVPPLVKDDQEFQTRWDALQECLTTRRHRHRRA